MQPILLQNREHCAPKLAADLRRGRELGVDCGRRLKWRCCMRIPKRGRRRSRCAFAPSRGRRDGLLLWRLLALPSISHGEKDLPSAGWAKMTREIPTFPRHGVVHRIDLQVHHLLARSRTFFFFATSAWRRLHTQPCTLPLIRHIPFAFGSSNKELSQMVLSGIGAISRPF